jgi:ABC-type uncharacterized transport system permease subunit
MKSAQDVIMALWASGYAATDIIQTLFKVICLVLLMMMMIIMMVMIFMSISIYEMTIAF